MLSEATGLPREELRKTIISLAQMTDRQMQAADLVLDTTSVILNTRVVRKIDPIRLYRIYQKLINNLNPQLIALSLLKDGIYNDVEAAMKEVNTAIDFFQHNL